MNTCEAIAYAIERKLIAAPIKPTNPNKRKFDGDSIRRNLSPAFEQLRAKRRAKEIVPDDEDTDTDTEVEVKVETVVKRTVEPEKVKKPRNRSVDLVTYLDESISIDSDAVKFGPILVESWGAGATRKTDGWKYQIRLRHGFRLKRTIAGYPMTALFRFDDRGDPMFVIDVPDSGITHFGMGMNGLGSAFRKVRASLPGIPTYGAPTAFGFSRLDLVRAITHHNRN